MSTNILFWSRIYKTTYAILFCSLVMLTLSGLPFASSMENPAYSDREINSFDICTAINEAGGSLDFIRITAFAKISESYETLDGLRERIFSLLQEYRQALGGAVLSDDDLLYTLTSREDKGTRQVKASFTLKGVQGTIIFQNKETETIGEHNKGIIDSDINEGIMDSNINKGIIYSNRSKVYLCKNPTNIGKYDIVDIQKKSRGQGNLSKTYNTIASADIYVYFCNEDIVKTSEKEKNISNNISKNIIKNISKNASKNISATADRADDIKENLEMYFNHKYNGISISTTYKGTFDEKVKYNEMEMATKTVFNKLGGYELENLTGQNFTSRTGYSPGIQDSYRKDNNIMNINVALRYNKYDNKSYLWVGIPVINAEY